MCSRGRADEGDVVRLENIAKRAFRTGSRSRDERVGAGNFTGREDLRNVQVAVAGRRGADADAFVSEPHVHGRVVGGGVHGHGRDAELLAGPQDAERDLAAIGDQYLIEHVCLFLARPRTRLDDPERINR